MVYSQEERHYSIQPSVQLKNSSDVKKKKEDMIAGTYWCWVPEPFSSDVHCIARRYKSHLILNKRKPQWLKQAKYTQVATTQSWINDSWAIIAGINFNWQETKLGISVLERKPSQGLSAYPWVRHLLIVPLNEFLADVLFNQLRDSWRWKHACALTASQKHGL